MNDIKSISTKNKTWQVSTQEIFNEQQRKIAEYELSSKGKMWVRLWGWENYVKYIERIEDRFNAWYRITDFDDSVQDIGSNYVLSIEYFKV